MQFILFELLFALFAITELFAGQRDVMDVARQFFHSYNVKEYNKCGFHILATYYSMPSANQSTKAALQTRPLNDTSIVSPSGKFRIHFDTSGVNQPFLVDSTGQKIAGTTTAFVDSVAQICDYVYYTEVDSLGYPPPPSDSGAGGGNEYDIYIQNLEPGMYGYTDWDESRPIIMRKNATYAAWMVIDNLFSSSYTKGVAAIKVTIAHEFHHGIQIGNYGLWGNDLYFYELTSTWIEQVVYPEIKDYYQYLPNFFANPGRPFNEYRINTYAGYERCIYGIFVQQDYGLNMMRTIWTYMSGEPSIPAIEDAFNGISVSPAFMFTLFARTNYFTGYRSTKASYFATRPYLEAPSYPLVAIKGTAFFTGDEILFGSSTMRLSEAYYQIIGQTDTLTVVIANTNFKAAADFDTTAFPYSLTISMAGANCLQRLEGGYCLGFEVSDITSWGVIPLIPQGMTVANQNLPFPQPFNPFRQVENIPVPLGISSPIVEIYDISGRLLRRITGVDNVVTYPNGRYLLWDGKDDHGKTLNNGVYIYIVTDGRNTNITGKIAIVRK
ncbi:MAG: MXAN_6640 family putative metalloprotease [Candidatus Kryptoniota bacterium]